MKTIVRYFLQGLILTLPISITIFVVITVVDFFDVLFKNYLPWEIPGLGILLAFVGITVVGIFASSFITKSAEAYFDDVMRKAPVIKGVYFAVKDIISSLIDKDKKFDRPVVVKLREDSELYQLGFITQEDLSNLAFDEEMVFVYLPHSYAVSGLHCIVPRKNVRIIDQSSSETMKFILSGGMAKIDSSKKKKKEESQKSKVSTTNS